MKDLNYFDIYMGKKDSRVYSKGIFYLLVSVLLLFIIIYTLFNQIKTRQISKDIAKLESILEDDRIIKKIDAIKKKDEEVKEFNASLEKYRLLDKIVEENSIIDDNLLNNITSRTPDDIYFTSITMNTDNIEIIGVSEEQYSIATFGRSLESVKHFKEIFISSISKEDKFFSFIININLKDVSLDGEDEILEEDSIEEENDQD